MGYDGAAQVGHSFPMEDRPVKIAIIIFVVCWTVVPAAAQQQADKCFVLCRPELKVEPTFSWENLSRKTRIAETDSEGNTIIRTLERERVFETVIGLDIPSTIPRVSFTFETIVKPLVKGNSPELETEVNLHWLPSEVTNGWVGSHFDIVDKYSPGGRPDTTDLYTHKLNFELDTAVSFLKWTRKPWLSDIEIESSIDYVATGLPRAGDRFGNLTYLDNASGWSFSLVFILPIAPIFR
jgi:hypothetical protein